MINVQIRFPPAYCNFVPYSGSYRVIVSGINRAISWNIYYLYIYLFTMKLSCQVFVNKPT